MLKPRLAALEMLEREGGQGEEGVREVRGGGVGSGRRGDGGRGRLAQEGRSGVRWRKDERVVEGRGKDEAGEKERGGREERTRGVRREEGKTENRDD